MTIDDLRAFGANVEEGLTRCMNNEAFYLRLTAKAVSDDAPERLCAALRVGDLDAAFEIAHQLKGVYGNLALTPLFSVASGLTERLRGREPGDYLPAAERIVALRDELRALL
ncbi:MAG: Hpt domain-containing protein [Clostridia bacterium]|nr:Hpt domain-containing protein [Clostridia bacterium]